jgi:hypothetical protein
MNASPLLSVYHDRLDLASYDQAFASIPEAEYTHHDACSPFDVWSVERLRRKLPEQPIKMVPTDVFVWGRGEPKHHASSKIGGVPAWPAGEKLPSERKWMGLLSSPLRFFGQFNFLDSVDLMPKLPGSLLSVWGTADFPWESGSIQTFWLDAATVQPVLGLASNLCLKGMRTPGFFASLHRTWDPIRGQNLVPAIVDHQFEAYRSYKPRSWQATKFGGVGAMPQSGDEETEGHFFLQFASIQPAPEVPWPWLNREQPFDLWGGDNCYSAKENSLVLGDMGGIGFYLKPDGSVATSFECG